MWMFVSGIFLLRHRRNEENSLKCRVCRSAELPVLIQYTVGDWLVTTSTTITSLHLHFMRSITLMMERTVCFSSLYHFKIRTLNGTKALESQEIQQSKRGKRISVDNRKNLMYK